ncbi:hypothetical protein V8E52_001333 [Russula decolorans]
MGPESGKNVVLRDFDGNVLSSVWQYGLMDWDLFHTCLDAIIFANDSWAIFHYDEHAPGRKGALCPAACKEYPTPGTYILLTPDGSPISVGLVATAARPRHPTTSNAKQGQILIANKFALVTLTASYRVSKFLKVILLNVSADRNGTELGSPHLGLNFYGEDTSSPLLPGYDDVAGKVLKLDQIYMQICVLLTNFSATIFFKLC